jgi:uncharacterized protein YndB with AHSA1/START domain
VLAWQLSADFQFVRELVTEVELRFTPEGARATRVELEHRNLERYGELAAKVREMVGAPNGWGLVLENYERAINQSEESNP